MEQAHEAVDIYFDFLMNSISAFPTFGTEIGDRWKRESLLNVAAFQELVERLSMANGFEKTLRIQMAFMHSQLNRLGKETTSFGAGNAKPVDDATKKLKKESSD